MKPNPYQIYQQNTVQTSGPQLILMLYDGAIRFTRLAIEGIEQKDFGKTNTNLIKAQKIVHELSASLDFNYEISKNLAALYEYMMHQLIEANIRKDVGPAKEVLGHLMDLKATWTTAIRSNAPTASVQQI